MVTSRTFCSPSFSLWRVSSRSMRLFYCPTSGKCPRPNRIRSTFFNLFLFGKSGQIGHRFDARVQTELNSNWCCFRFQYRTSARLIRRGRSIPRTKALAIESVARLGHVFDELLKFLLIGMTRQRGNRTLPNATTRTITIEKTESNLFFFLFVGHHQDESFSNDEEREEKHE